MAIFYINNRVISDVIYSIKKFVINNKEILVVSLITTKLNLKNMVGTIISKLLNKYLINLKNYFVNLLKISLWNFFKDFLFFILCSNKSFYHEKFIEAFEILVKKILNLKYTNYILLGSLYCSLNNIKFLEIETNLFMCITIFLFLVHLYNFILEYKNLKDTFLNTNKFKLVLIILIVISFFVVSFELCWFLDSLYSKFCIFINSFFRTVLGPTSSRGSSQGGSPPPNGEPIIAAQANSNRKELEENSRDSPSHGEIPVAEEIPVYFVANEIGLEGEANGVYAETGKAKPIKCVPAIEAGKPNRLEDLPSSLTWRTFKPGNLDKFKKIEASRNAKELQKAIGVYKKSLVGRYKNHLDTNSNEKSRRIEQEKINVINFLNLLKKEVDPKNASRGLDETKIIALRFLSFHDDRINMYNGMPEYRDLWSDLKRKS